jgi:glycosyltransferase involved in cell wall biosynthesis
MTEHEVTGARERSVLHVLPHPGGGGERYVDDLSAIKGYRADRAYLSRAAKPGRSAPLVVKNAVGVQWASRSHDLLHVHGEIASAACLPALGLVPSVVTLHGLHWLRRASGASRLAAQANLRLIVRAATRTICVSEAEHAEVVETVGARVARRTVVIHNGVAPQAPPSPDDRAAVRAELGIAEGTCVGVLVGGLDEHKDPLTPVRAALAAARAGADVALVVVGNGPLLPRLEEAAREGPAGAIHVTGFRTDVARILAGADFFTLSSRREGFSYALLEAMSLGLPAVVSDAPGNPEAVGDAGIVVPYGDVAGFAAAFGRLAGDRPMRRALGAAGRGRAASSFGLEEMLRRTQEVYAAAAAGEPAS